MPEIPWPSFGQSSWMAEVASTSNTLEEVHKEATSAGAGAIVGFKAITASQDRTFVALAKSGSNDHIHDIECSCGDKKAPVDDRAFSFFDADPWSLTDPWSPTGAGVKAVDTTPKILNDESDVLPVEEKKEVKLDILPWFSMPNNTSEAWVPPHHCNTECWHQDPVDVAARRHELAGHFKEASNLRIGFRGLSVLHRRVLRWYGWARKQRALNAISSSEKKELNGSSNIPCKTKLHPREANNEIDANYIQKFFEGKEFLSEIFASALAPADEINVYIPRTAVNQAAKESQKINDIDNSAPMRNTTHEHHPVALDFIGSAGHQKANLLNPGRIISQQLKDKLFRNCFPNGLHADSNFEGSHTNSGDSIAYRNHARWVLENNVMSDDSENDSDGFVDQYMATHPISQGQPQEIYTRESGRLPARSLGHALAENSLNDLFFLGDSDSSDYRSGKISDSDDGFPVISGEELEKLLEETKGTLQFHRWQNAPAGRRQKEFKTLINLHRFVKNSEDRNQKHWRSREHEEREIEFRTNAQNKRSSSSHLPPVFTSPEGSVSRPSRVPLLNKKSELDLPPSIVPNETTFSQKFSEGLKEKSQPVSEETDDYSRVTADDIKFLRELKKQLEQAEATRQTGDALKTISHDNSEDLLPGPRVFDKNASNMAMRNLMGYFKSKPDRAATSNPREKSLHDTLRIAKPLPGIGHRIEFENWFSRDQFEGLTACRSGLSQEYHGPTPKRHYPTTLSGGVSFRSDSVEHHPFSQAVKSSIFKRLVTSTGRFWNPKAKIFLSGFWVTDNLFITALNFHPWAPSTTVESLSDQIEDFKLRNDGIKLFVSSSYLDPSDDPEAIRVVLRAWDTSARIAVFKSEDKNTIPPNSVGVDMLIEEDTAYSYDGAYIATVGYNTLDAARGDPLGSKLLTPGTRSATFGGITISEGYQGNEVRSPPVFARLESGFSHGSYGRICITMGTDQKNSGSIIGLVTGQCEERGPHRPEALSDFVSTFPNGFKEELRRISRQ